MPHLHSLQSYTFVTTITYYTLTLADFSYQLLSQIITHFTSSHSETLAEILLREFTALSPRAFGISALYGHPENGRYIVELC
jgi:hypothetical protein